MSAPAQDGPGLPGGKKRGLSKMVSRWKTVLKRSDGSRRLSFSTKPAAAAVAAAAPSEAPSSSSQPAPIEGSALVVDEGVAEEPEEPAVDGLPQATKVMRSQIEADRVRRMGERFAISIEPLSYGADRETYRIEKAIRMRVHRYCHQCSASFEGNKVCVQCQHVRCKSCPRYPARKTEKEKKKGTAREKKNVAPDAVAAIEPDTYWGLRDEQIVLTRPSPRPGAQPLVLKKPKQRVRRACHACSTLFPGGCKICPTCEHVRCVECPRTPAKKSRYPDGYPGDAPSSNTALPVKYECHKCIKVFPAVPHPDSAEGIARRESNVAPPECTRCQHVMCPDCPRAPPRRVEPTPDPAVLQSIRAKLAVLSVANPT